MKKKALAIMLAVTTIVSTVGVPSSVSAATTYTGTLYGTATLSYTEFYQGDTDVEEYDAVTSATTNKNTIFDNEDSTTPDESGYTIYGVKNVPVAVDAEIYNEAMKQKEAGTLPETGLYAEAAAITLNEDPTVATAQYKTLTKDGDSYKYVTTSNEETVTDATLVTNNKSNWGNCQLEVTETSTKYLRNAREGDFAISSNILGIIVTATDGTSVGLRHLEEIWVQPWEMSFNIGSVAAETLSGKTVNKISFITPEKTYVYSFAAGAAVPTEPSADSHLDAVLSADKTSVTVDLSDLPSDSKDVAVSVSGSGKGGAAYAVDAAVDENGAVTLTEAVAEDVTALKVYVTSSNYMTVKGTIATAPAALASDNVSVAKDGTVTVTVDQTVLEENTDYEVSTKLNASKGKLTTTVKGINSYSGTVKTSVSVKPAKVTAVKASSGSKKTAKLSWKKVSGATGYQITYSTDKSFASSKTKNVKKTGATLKKLTSGTTVYVKVRAYKTVNGKKVYGAQSAVKKVVVK